MDQKPFMYLRNGVLLYDSEGKEAMAEKEAGDIIDIIKEINPNLDDANDEDVTKDEIEDTVNGSSQDIDWGAKIIDVFKNGCLKWKPSLDKDHKSLLTTKAHTNFTQKTYSEDNKIKETKEMYGKADANFNASSSGHLKISMGEKNSVKAEYDAKVNGCGEASCIRLFDKRSNDKKNERELLIAQCEAKGKLEGEFQGSASFTAEENEGKADMNVKFGVHGQASFTGDHIKSKNSNKEGRVKVLHGNAKGNAEIKAAGTFGKHRVNLEAKTKGKAKFKAVDGNFDFTAKKRNDGIYIPGVKGIVGQAKAKGEADFSLNAEICGRKIDKKRNVSGKAEASALTLNALEVDIRKEKDDGTVRKAKASVKGMEGNICNVEATGKRSGDITRASATLTGAKVNIGNVTATGIDDRTIHSANATLGLSADIGNVKASFLGHKGTTAEIDASLGMQMFNISAGIARDTGGSASTKFSMFNVNLTIGTPSLNISMPSLGPNISIPFLSAGGGGQTAGNTNDSNGKDKNETGSFTGQERENVSNKEGSLNTDGNFGKNYVDGEPSQCGSIAQNNIDSCTNNRFSSKSYIENKSNTSLDKEEKCLTSLNDGNGTRDGDAGPVESGVIAEDNTGCHTKDGLGSGTCIGHIREGCSNSEGTNLSSLEFNDYIGSCDDEVGLSERRSMAGENMGSCTNFEYGSGSGIGNEIEGSSISEGTNNSSLDLNDCIKTCDEDVGDEQTAEKVNNKTFFKGTGRQAAEDLKTQTNFDDMLDNQTSNEQEQKIYTQLPKRTHGKSPRLFGMHQRTSGLSSTDTSQENDVKAEPLRTSRKYSSESHKSIPTHYKDDEYYNKYLVNLVNDRFDKSKGKYKNNQSEKTAKNESAIWRDPEKLKQALVEKYAKGPNARDNVTAKRNSVENTKERDIEDNAAKGQSTESDDRTPKSKKKEEPKKPFGANKNIHTIFTLAGAESKPVKYLKDNFACFTDE